MAVFCRLSKSTPPPERGISKMIMSSGYTRAKFSDSASGFLTSRNPSQFRNAIQDMAQNNNSGVRQKLNQIRKNSTAASIEVEEAAMILLFQIASADGIAQGASLHLIGEGLKRIFLTPQDRVMPLLHNAKGVLQNKLLSTTPYSDLLKEHLTDDLKSNLISVADDMLRSMGDKAEVAIFYRNRLAASLGLN